MVKLPVLKPISKGTEPVKSGNVYGWLTVLAFEARKIVGNRGRNFYRCRCECGAIKSVMEFNLRYGSVKSCGCYQKKRTSDARFKHGMIKTREYQTWTKLMSRCYRLSDPKFPRYGGRGVEVCDRWRKSFVNFIKDMGFKPGRNYTIERIDNNGNYEPGNCRWATCKEQNNNRSTNRFVEHGGERLTIQQWAKKVGIDHQTLYNRLVTLRWPVEKALTKPVGNNRGKKA